MPKELIQAHPQAASLPHVSLATLPTPVEAWRALGQELGLSKLYGKRDDRSGQLYGGNKVRKLEFLLGEVLAQGRREVITIGAVGSNHVLATCLYARALGLSPAAQHYPQPMTQHVVDNLRALSTTRPELRLLGHPAALPFELFRERLKAWLKERPQLAYIPAGGSSGVGALGYVSAAFELAAQVERGELPEPEAIFVTAGTCGTVAGLALGLRMAKLRSRVIGVRVVDRVVCNQANITRLITQCIQRLREVGVHPLPQAAQCQVTLLHDHFGAAYGVPTAEGIHAMRLAHERQGVSLDPTYTSKTMAALIAQRHALKLRDEAVLFWHTLSSVDLSERIAQADLSALGSPYLDLLRHPLEG